MQYDVFNGDADGICGLLQWRLAYPEPSILVTGIKRDIALLERVPARAGDRVTVLDVSLDRNRAALLKLLAGGVELFYIDHHFAGEIPIHPRFSHRIDTASDCCTSLLMNAHLAGRHVAWAVVGAYGDNLDSGAAEAAQSLSLSARQLLELRQLGICINYNAYGSCLEDLNIAPDDLYRRLSVYATPFQFVADQPELYRQLLDGYAADMAAAAGLEPEFSNEAIAVYVLPDQKWARRVSGVWANALANGAPERAHAIVGVNARGSYHVSVRAPLTNKAGADELCAGFGGGGRKAAAGIDDLAIDRFDEFVETFNRRYSDLR